MLDGDKIEIRSKPNTIQIKGEINAPGYYKYKSRTRISNVIEEAGGLTQDAEVDEIFITYANGKSKKYSPYFGNAKVYDGSIITIGRKPEEEPFDKTEYFKELTSIIANLAQALSLIILANGGV